MVLPSIISIYVRQLLQLGVIQLELEINLNDIPINYKYIYNLKYMKICAGTFPVDLPVLIAGHVVVMGFNDFHGATLQVELAGPRPINIRILISPTTPCSVYRATGCSTGEVYGRAGLQPFKCTGCVLLYVHIYVRVDV